ncbi:hypothetical protein [Aurantiacibacter poecillastricola]|uniref:hypothetical protein n=1 Tax=Aurantiacibacter poecillastricola TaxID=3064385 RepID=UPI00273F15B6|nr:hypothetical protein [Aurantiacibacter sp. 219JJ12-13]MDP5263223.1 hypothetical protein [Aurantiacibacter sp. 219JJ12-13]
MPSCDSPSLSVCYLVHDLNDAAVARRVSALVMGGAVVRLAGFWRREAVDRVEKSEAVPLARSYNAGFLQRLALVLRQLLSPDRRLREAARADVLLARNLEMLVLARRLASTRQQVVYECLDIHRLMLRDDALGAAFRLVERLLLRRCNMIITSSPAYAREYFRALQSFAGHIELVENKVNTLPAHWPGQGETAQAASNPWRIGWFGMLRCPRSLAILAKAAREAEGGIEIVIAGIPSHPDLDDLEARVGQMEGVTFLGRYRPEDLPDMYAAVDFAWCVDFFEEGLNSDWLLPNRLYESIAHGAVPIALEGVECGRWLEQRQLGLVLARAEGVVDRLVSMSRADFERARKRVEECPRDAIAFTPTDHRLLVGRLEELA